MIFLTVHRWEVRKVIVGNLFTVMVENHLENTVLAIPSDVSRALLHALGEIRRDFIFRDLSGEKATKRRLQVVVPSLAVILGGAGLAGSLDFRNPNVEHGLNCDRLKSLR
jgi:hypothetical protein